MTWVYAGYYVVAFVTAPTFVAGFGLGIAFTAAVFRIAERLARRRARKEVGASR